MSAMASQITSLMIVYSTICSGADQRKHQSSASLAFVRWIHRSLVNSPHNGPVTQKIFPFDDIIMASCRNASISNNSSPKRSMEKPTSNSVKSYPYLLHRWSNLLQINQSGILSLITALVLFIRYVIGLPKYKYISVYEKKIFKKYLSIIPERSSVFIDISVLSAVLVIHLMECFSIKMTFYFSPMGIPMPGKIIFILKQSPGGFINSSLPNASVNRISIGSGNGLSPIQRQYIQLDP